MGLCPSLRSIRHVDAPSGKFRCCRLKLSKRYCVVAVSIDFFEGELTSVAIFEGVKKGGELKSCDEVVAFRSGGFEGLPCFVEGVLQNWLQAEDDWESENVKNVSCELTITQVAVTIVNLAPKFVSLGPGFLG